MSIPMMNMSSNTKSSNLYTIKPLHSTDRTDTPPNQVELDTLFEDEFFLHTGGDFMDFVNSTFNDESKGSISYQSYESVPFQQANNVNTVGFTIMNNSNNPFFDVNNNFGAKLENGSSKTHCRYMNNDFANVNSNSIKTISKLKDPKKENNFNSSSSHLHHPDFKYDMPINSSAKGVGNHDKPIGCSTRLGTLKS